MWWHTLELVRGGKQHEALESMSGTAVKAVAAHCLAHLAVNADEAVAIACAAAGLSALALVLGLLFLKESLSPEIRQRLAKKQIETRRRQFRNALARPNVGFLILLSFMATFAFAGLEATSDDWEEMEEYEYAFV